MRIAASGASPLLAMTVEMSQVKNIGHSEGDGPWESGPKSPL